MYTYVYVYIRFTKQAQDAGDAIHARLAKIRSGGRLLFCFVGSSSCEGYIDKPQHIYDRSVYIYVCIYIYIYIKA